MFLVISLKNEKFRNEILDKEDLFEIHKNFYANLNSSKIEGRIYSKDIENLKRGTPPNLEDAPDGEYSVINFNQNEVNIYTDPNGYRHLYYYSSDEFDVVSNDFEKIFDFLKGRKINLSFSYETTLASILMGVSFFPGTGVKEIKLLNTNEYIHLDLEKRKITIKNRNYFDFAEFIFNKRISRSDLLNIVSSRLKKNALNILEDHADKEKIVEVTGGSDSRLVLGTLLACRFKDFKVYTFGKIDSLDQRVSQQIQNMFGLDTINYSNDITRLHAAKQRWKITAGAFLPVDISYRSAFKRKSHLAFAGTGGELSRGYFTKQTYNKNYTSAKEIKIVDDVSAFRMLLENYSLRNLLTNEFKWLIATESANYYKDFPYAKELHLLLDYAFFQSRLRWHFGKQTMLRDQLFIETPAIMNDFMYHSLIFSTNHIERISDKNVYDLLNILYQPLNFLPFTNPPKFDKTFQEHLFINLPAERTAKPIASIEKYGRKDSDSDLDRKELHSLFLEFIEDENYSQYILKDKFMSLINSPNKDLVLDKFSPLLYWNHYSK